MALDISQIDRICRTCLSDDGVMRSLFSVDDSLGQNTRLFEMLMSCTCVQVITPILCSLIKCVIEFLLHRKNVVI